MLLRHHFLSQLEILLSTERDLVSALPQVAAAASTAELRQAFEHHLEETARHVTRVEHTFHSLTENPVALSSAVMTALIATATVHIHAEPAGPLRDIHLIGDAQCVEHFEIAAYTSAIAVAKTLGLATAANLLMENLHDELKASDTLSKLSKTALHAAATQVVPC